MRLQGRSSFVSLLVFALFATGASASDVADVYQTVFQNVSQAHLQTFLKDMTGYNPVTVAGKSFSITDRYMPASKENFRKYWTAYYQSLGMNVTALNYKT